MSSALARTARRDADLVGALSLLVLTVLVVATSAPSVVRFPVTFAFLLLAPGTGWVRLLHLRRPVQELELVVAASLASDVVLSQLTTALASFSLRSVVVVLGVWTVLGLLACFAARERTAPIESVTA